MASVFFRGPRASARWFGRYRDADGVWRSKRATVDNRAAAMKLAMKWESEATLIREGLKAPASAATTMGVLLDRFVLQLKNRSWANDRSRVRVHLKPYWRDVLVGAVDLPRILMWLEHLRTSTLAAGTQRGLLGLLSRALAFAVSNGLAAHNVVRNVPAQARPSAPPPLTVRWLEDDEMPAKILATLPPGFREGWYLGFSTGARVGECFALRLGDIDLEAASIRLAGSWRGPLKEDKGPKGTGKTKFAPCPSDAATILGPWLERRRAEGAGPDDLVFPNVKPYHVSYQWARACKALGLEGLTYHHSTRTTFCSRAAARGATLEAIAEAVGHAGVGQLRRTYMRFVRRSFDPRLCAGLATMPPAAKVFPIAASRASGAAFDGSVGKEDEHAA